MERVRLIYEQIEEANKHLLSGSVLGLRLALILLDNAAELIMYRELQHEFGWYEYWRPNWQPALEEWIRAGLGPEYTEEEREAAEREFEPKLRILSFRLERISPEERTVLSACHKLRSDAFHRGLLRPQILLQICRLLYLTVADLTLKLPFKSYSLPGSAPTAENAAFLRRYGLTDPHLLSGQDALQQLRRKLVEDITLDPAEFATVLSTDLVERIDSTIEGLAYVGETEDDAKIDHNLQYTQFWRDQGAELMRNGIREPELGKAFTAWQAAGQARFTLSKVERWRRASEAISRQTNPSRALGHYWAIDKRFKVLEGDVTEAVIRYDEEINMRVHDSRR